VSTSPRLHATLGLPDPEGAGEGVPADLLAGAVEFLRAGGRPTLAEWAAQSPLERRALALAGRRLADGDDDLASPAAPAPDEAAPHRDWDAARRDLLAELHRRGCDLADVPALNQALERLGLRGLLRALTGGFDLAAAADRFEAAWARAAAPTA